MIEIKFSEWYLKWFELYRSDGIRQVTKNKYLKTYEIISGHEIGSMDIKKINREDAQRYIDFYGEKRSKLTVMDHTQTLRSCMSDAHQDGLVKTNPFARVKLVYKEQRLSFSENKALREQKKWLEVDEYERLKSFLVIWLDKSLEQKPFTFNGANSSRAQINIMLIFIALKTGMRFSEILGLTVSDVDYDSQTLNVEKTWDYKIIDDGKFVPTKNYASVRNIPIDDESIRIIKKYIDWKDRHELDMEMNTLFCEKKFRIFNSTTNNILERFLISLGIEIITMHKLRHTQASYLLAKGIPITVVAKRLGHTDTKMVQRTYGHLLKETEEDANQKILELL